ncbi:MAG: PIN domain-containing protein [Sphingomonadaceae bacterium]
MTGFAFDANIVIDALAGYTAARSEIERAASANSRPWISRMAWIEILSKGDEAIVRDALAFLARFGLDELDDEISHRAAALRRERPKLKSPDAVILATAQTRNRILVTRNIKDFPAGMPGIRVPYTL